MSDSHYKGESTRGGKWGCAVASLFGIPVFMLATLVASLGDCMPDIKCHPGFWLEVILPTAFVATPIGLGVRWLLNRRSNDDS
ncbi:hypothetical protein [Sphingomonas kyungheensis]|uniref:DUF2798 domain-containing protein n=1 Tax=Sphingomonas kyungheensis TaxID=1069987 RepID=A0ABU8H446_9SPHN